MVKDNEFKGGGPNSAFLKVGPAKATKKSGMQSMKRFGGGGNAGGWNGGGSGMQPRFGQMNYGGGGGMNFGVGGGSGGMGFGGGGNNGMGFGGGGHNGMGFGGGGHNGMGFGGGHNGMGFGGNGGMNFNGGSGGMPFTGGNRFGNQMWNGGGGNNNWMNRGHNGMMPGQQSFRGGMMNSQNQQMQDMFGQSMPRQWHSSGASGTPFASNHFGNGMSKNNQHMMRSMGHLNHDFRAPSSWSQMKHRARSHSPRRQFTQQYPTRAPHHQIDEFRHNPMNLSSSNNHHHNHFRTAHHNRRHRHHANLVNDNFQVMYNPIESSVDY